jgi:hypothetical protein
VHESTSTRRLPVGKKRKGKKMTNIQTRMVERTEEEFVVELEHKSPLELRNFMMGPWTASILSPEAIEELYAYLKLRLEESPQQEGVQSFVGLD